MTHDFQWPDPVRTGTDDASTIAARTHIPNPAAVANLKRVLAEKEAARAAEQERRRATRANDKVVAGLLARQRARQQPGKTIKAADGRVPSETAAPSHSRPRRKKTQPPHPLLRDEEQVRAIHARHVAGVALTPLAGNLGMDKRTLRAAFERYDLPVIFRRGPAARPLTAAELDAAVAARREGRPWKAIAAGLHTTTRPLREQLRQAGYETAAQARHNASNHRLDDDHIRALHARYEAGEAASALADAVGIGYDTLRRRFRALGLPFSPRRRGGRPLDLSLQQVEAALTTRAAGRTWADIATEMGRSSSALRDALRRLGHVTDDRSGSIKLTAGQVAAAVADHEVGRTWEAIAAEMGVTVDTLQRARRQAGHPMQMRQKLSEDELTAAAADLAAGHSLTRLAARYDIDRHALRRALKQRGYEARAHVITPLDEALVRALHGRHAAGATAKALADEQGIPSTRLLRAFRRLGLPVTGYGNLPYPFTEAEIAAAVADHEAGRTWNDIAAGLGVTGATICKAVARAGHNTGRPALKGKPRR